eukprot:scaffold3710_cov286-Chaetoceros_neogracile.AAC.30
MHDIRLLYLPSRQIGLADHGCKNLILLEVQVLEHFKAVSLPDGLFVCGDYMATATLNGAIENGLNAARCAVGYLEKAAVVAAVKREKVEFGNVPVVSVTRTTT